MDPNSGAQQGRVSSGSLIAEVPNKNRPSLVDPDRGENPQNWFSTPEGSQVTVIKQ